MVAADLLVINCGQLLTLRKSDRKPRTGAVTFVMCKNASEAVDSLTDSRHYEPPRAGRQRMR